MKEYTVKELAALLEKSEETIKRWIRSGKFPNSYITSPKEGWRVPEEDIKPLIEKVETEKKWLQTMKVYTVKELASLFGKNEETIKRWIHLRRFPNAYMNSQKEGWRIPEEDVKLLIDKGSTTRGKSKVHHEISTNYDEIELVKLAYEAVTLTSPTDEILTVLSVVGIKRTLEILLIMQQSHTKVKNPDGFIKKAIRENWSPSSTTVKLPKSQSKRISQMSQRDFDQAMKKSDSNQPSKLEPYPFYNWLED